MPHPEESETLHPFSTTFCKSEYGLILQNKINSTKFCNFYRFQNNYRSFFIFKNKAMTDEMYESLKICDYFPKTNNIGKLFFFLEKL